MELLLIGIPLVVGLVGGAVSIFSYLLPRKHQQALPAPAPTPQPKPTIESYHTLAEIWDYTLAGSGAPKPSGDAQYAGMQAEAPRRPAGPSGVSASSRGSQYALQKTPEPQRQSFGHLGLDYGLFTASTITASRITADTLHIAEPKVSGTRQDNEEDSYTTRVAPYSLTARPRPYRGSGCVRIISAWEKVQVVGYVHGDRAYGPDLTDIWYVIDDGGTYVWSGSFSNTTTNGLPQYVVDEPDIFEQKSFTGETLSLTIRHPPARLYTA